MKANREGSQTIPVARVAPERAIEIARRAGLPPITAAKVDKVDIDYYKARVEPLLDNPLTEFVGEAADCEKGALLGDAASLLVAIDWPEPFGFIQIEAMASGTPVIARLGAVPEIVEDDVAGFVVGRIEEAVAPLPTAQRLDRTEIRRRFDARFRVERMARDYVVLYGGVLSRARSELNSRAAAAIGDS